MTAKVGSCLVSICLSHAGNISHHNSLTDGSAACLCSLNPPPPHHISLGFNHLSIFVGESDITFLSPIPSWSTSAAYSTVVGLAPERFLHSSLENNWLLGHILNLQVVPSTLQDPSLIRPSDLDLSWTTSLFLINVFLPGLAHRGVFRIMRCRADASEEHTVTIWAVCRQNKLVCCCGCIF